MKVGLDFVNGECCWCSFLIWNLAVAYCAAWFFAIFGSLPRICCPRDIIGGAASRYKQVVVTGYLPTVLAAGWVGTYRRGAGCHFKKWNLFGDRREKLPPNGGNPTRLSRVFVRSRVRTLNSLVFANQHRRVWRMLTFTKCVYVSRRITERIRS